MLFLSTHLLRTLLRQAIVAGSRILPEPRNVAIERRLRGYEEVKKLEKADAVVVSFGKSGRTWLAVLLSRYYAKKHGLPEGRIMNFNDFNRLDSSIPVVFFTHDNYINDYLEKDNKLEIYRNARIILLVRDPRDTAVSQYFQWKHRMSARKKVINNYPEEDESVFDFVSGSRAGIPKIIAFMNAWARDLNRFDALLLAKYEDLRADTRAELRRILVFLSEAPSDVELDDCISYASIDNMRKLEERNAAGWLRDRRLTPANANDLSSFKVRRGKVGGWRDYMSEEEASRLDKLVQDELSPVYGYR